jgi:hypothetical protein
MLLDVSISIFIVILNILLTRLSVYLVEWVGFHTHSEIYANVSICIFITTFFNTAIVVLLANANLSEVLPFIS